MSKKKKNKPVAPPPKLEDVIAKVPESIKDVKLARAIKGLPYKEVTIARFCELMKDETKNREEITQFVYDRFHQRYLLPFEKVPVTVNSGFAQMAISCLMIEAMESFRNGWNDTREVFDEDEKQIFGGDIFENFFAYYAEFAEFKGLGKEFYSNVRCGILHQAETKNGWRIVRSKKLPFLDKNKKTIHATIFRRRMKKALQAYCVALKDINKPEWTKFKTKMAYIIQNCLLEGAQPNALPLVGEDVKSAAMVEFKQKN